MTGVDSVTVTFEDGTQASGNLLIGAEGAHSPSREYLLGVEEAALMPSPIVASISLCNISREAALKLRAMQNVITLHPNGTFTFMSRKYNLNLAQSCPAHEIYVHSA